MKLLAYSLHCIAERRSGKQINEIVLATDNRRYGSQRKEGPCACLEPRVFAVDGY